METLSKRYGSVDVLQDISFRLPPRARVGLLGANGAGKSTLIRILAGLTRPTSGTVRFRSAGTPDGRSVALVPQGKPVYGTLTVDAMLDLAGSMNGPGWRPEIARDWLTRFDVPTRRPCARLSGGERTHVSIALALGRPVPLLVMDEPFAELDPVARVDAIEALRGQLIEEGLLLIISSHLLSDIDQLCDHLVVLKHGRVVLTGPLEQIRLDHPGADLHDVVISAMRPDRRHAGTRS